MTSVPVPTLPAAQHMGSLHSVELVLFIALAVGPFLGLAAVVVVARRRDRDRAPEGDSRPAPPGSTNP